MDQLINKDPAAVPPEAAPPTTYDPGWGWREVGLALVSALALTLLLVLVTRGVVATLNLGEQTSLVSPALYVVGVGFYLALIGAVYGFAVRRAGWAALGLAHAGWVNFALVPPLYVLAALSVAAVNSLIAQLTGGFENPQITALTGGKPLAPIEVTMLFILAAILVPFAEELFYRGMIYPLMRRRFAVAIALFGNAALFAVTHFIPVLIPGLFILGLAMAYLRERSQSIWPSVCLHALQNGLVILALNALLAER